MQKTGIVRKIDNLGRIVIPKEIRNLLKIRNGSDIEINVQEKELIILKKVDTIDSGKDIHYLLKCFGKSLNANILFTSLDRIIDSYILRNNKLLTDILENDLTNSILSRKDCIIVLEKIFECKKKGYLFPLIINGDLKGSIVFLPENYNTSYQQSIKILLDILKKYLE